MSRESEKKWDYQDPELESTRFPPKLVGAIVCGVLMLAFVIWYAIAALSPAVPFTFDVTNRTPNPISLKVEIQNLDSTRTYRSDTFRMKKDESRTISIQAKRDFVLVLSVDGKGIPFPINNDGFLRYQFVVNADGSITSSL